MSSTYPEATADIEKVGDYNGFDVEKIISLSPDVVFAGNSLQQDQIDQLESAGLHVVSVDPTYYEDIAAAITLIGEEVGKADEACRTERRTGSGCAGHSGQSGGDCRQAYGILRDGYWRVRQLDIR